MKTKITKTVWLTSLFVIFLLHLNVSAQITEIPFGFSFDPISIGSDEDDFICPSKSGFELVEGKSYTSYNAVPGKGDIVGVAPKPQSKYKFYVLYSSGYIELYEDAGGEVKKLNNAQFNINNGYPDFTKFEGDALYLLDNSQLFISRDSGVTWAFDTAGVGTTVINDFALDTAQNVYAGANNNKLYYQNKDTSKWRAVPNFPSSHPYAVYIDRRDRIFVSIGSTIYYSYNLGHTWTLSGTIPNTISKMCDDVYGNIYGIDQSGLNIYRSVDGGATWTEPPGDASITIQESPVAFPPVIINGIAGDTTLIATTIYGAFTSADSGKTWIPVKGIKEGNINGFWKCRDGRIVESTNNGVFWLNKGDSVWHKPLPSNGYGAAGIIYGDTIGNIYTGALTSAVDAPYLKSSDSGTIWQADTLGNYLTYNNSWWVDQYGNEHANYACSTVYSKTPSNTYILDTAGIGIMSPNNYVSCFGSDGAGYLYMSNSVTTMAQVFRRPIRGGKWEADTAGIGGNYFIAFTHDANHAMVGIPPWPTSGLYYRKSGVWTYIPNPSSISSSATVSAIQGDSSGGILAAFYNYNASNYTSVGVGIYCTHDYGTTWNSIGLDSIYINQLVNCGGDSVYAITAGYGVYAITCNSIINTSAPSINSKSIIQNSVSVYPNPNNGNFTLEYNLPATSGELRIIDIMGREVYKSKITNSEGKQTINASGLNNGIYFWEVFAGDNVVEKGKVAVVK